MNTCAVPVAFLIERSSGAKEIVFSPLTDDHYMMEGDEATPLYAAIPPQGEPNTVSFHTADLPHKMPSTIIGGHENAAQSDEIGGVTPEPAPSMETINAASSEYGVGTAPTAPASTLPLSAKQIEGCRINTVFKTLHTNRLCDQALCAIDLDRQRAHVIQQLALVDDGGAPVEELARRAKARIKELEQQLAEKDRGYAILHGQFVEMRNRWKIAFDLKEKAEALVAEKDKELEQGWTKIIVRAEKAEAELAELRRAGK